MKTITLMLAIIGITFAGWSQSPGTIMKSIDDVEIVPAQFMGISYSPVVKQENDLLTDYLCKRIEYPEEAIKYHIQGTEVVKFTVSETGDISNIKVVNSVYPEIDQEFIRALKSTSGMWKPAKKGESNHECSKEVSLTFSLKGTQKNTQEYFTNHASVYFKKACKQLFLDHKLSKAECNLSRALNYTPYDGNILYLRGICRYEKGNIEGAMKDWERYTDITGLTVAPQELVLNMEGFKGVVAFANLNK